MFNDAHRTWLDVKNEPYRAIDIYDRIKREEIAYNLKEAYLDIVMRIESIGKEIHLNDEIYYNR